MKGKRSGGTSSSPMGAPPGRTSGTGGSSGSAREGRTCFLAPTEMVGVFLKTLGAGYSRKGREEDALRLYDEAERLYPGLPDAYYNAGVSLQKQGRPGEAEGKYLRALELDPEMAAAR